MELKEKRKLNAVGRLEVSTALKQLQLQTLQVEELRKKVSRLLSERDNYEAWCS